MNWSFESRSKSVNWNEDPFLHEENLAFRWFYLQFATHVQSLQQEVNQKWQLYTLEKPLTQRKALESEKQKKYSRLQFMQNINFHFPKTKSCNLHKLCHTKICMWESIWSFFMNRKKILSKFFSWVRLSGWHQSELLEIPHKNFHIYVLLCEPLSAL